MPGPPYCKRRKAGCGTGNEARGGLVGGLDSGEVLYIWLSRGELVDGVVE